MPTAHRISCLHLSHGASGGLRLTTNNRMEIFAAIAGLEMLEQPCKVTLYSDSQYLVKAISEGWVARVREAACRRNAWTVA